MPTVEEVRERGPSEVRGPGEVRESRCIRLLSHSTLIENHWRV